MIKVTSKIKSILADRDKQILTGQDAVAALLEETRKQILLDLAAIPGEGFTAHYLKQSLASIDEHLGKWETAADLEMGSGMAAMAEMGAELLPEAAGAAGLRLGHYALSASLLDGMKEFSFGLISGVRGDLYKKVRGEMTLGMLGQKTPQEVTAALMGDLAGKPIPVGKWGKPVFKSVQERVEVITGTELGRVFSLATQKSIEQAAGTVGELKKMWLHAGHPGAPRAIHLALHGQVRAVDKPFYQADGVPVMYPRDPNAPIKEVIRCGCTHIPYMEAFGDREAFAADFDTRQLEMWKGDGRKAA